MLRSPRCSRCCYARQTRRPRPWSAERRQRSAGPRRRRSGPPWPALRGRREARARGWCSHRTSHRGCSGRRRRRHPRPSWCGPRSMPHSSGSPQTRSWPNSLLSSWITPREACSPTLAARVTRRAHAGSMASGPGAKQARRSSRSSTPSPSTSVSLRRPPSSRTARLKYWFRAGSTGPKTTTSGSSALSACALRSPPRSTSPPCERWVSSATRCSRNDCGASASRGCARGATSTARPSRSAPPT